MDRFDQFPNTQTIKKHIIRNCLMLLMFIDSPWVHRFKHKWFCKKIILSCRCNLLICFSRFDLSFLIGYLRKIVLSKKIILYCLVSLNSILF